MDLPEHHPHQALQDMVAAPDFLLQVLWEGLVAGVLYALIALGFVLIYKSSRIFNFAQGIMVVFAALTLVGLHEKGVPACWRCR
jgi:branched-chain amino acid transport system permease protein